MPLIGMILLPIELTLKTAKNGGRLLNKSVNFWGNTIEVKKLEIYFAKSLWE